MVSIKNLVLKLLALILLFISLSSLVFYITFSNAVNDLNSLKNSVKTPLGLAIVGEFEQQGASGQMNIEQLKITCNNKEAGEQIPEEFNLVQLCNDLENGKIETSEDIKKSFGEGMAENLLNGATTDLYKQAVLLKGIVNYLLIVLIIAYLVSLLIVYLINMEITSTIQTFSYYNFILSLIVIIGIVVTYFVVPVIGNAAIEVLLKENDVGAEMEGVFEPILNLFISWLKEIILRPIYLFLGIALISLVGWRTKFGIRNNG